MLPINQLKIDNDDLKKVQKSAFKISKDLSRTDQTINEFRHHLDVTRHDHEPYFLLFLAYINMLSSADNNKTLIYRDLEKATRLFRRLGDEKWNEAITHWYLGIVYRDEGEDILAAHEFSDAQKLLTGIGALSEWEGDYETRDQCCKLLQKIDEDANIPTPIHQIKNIPAQYPFIKQNSWPIQNDAQLAFPVYDFVHAGTRGVFIFDDDAVNNANFEGPLIDETRYRILNIRSGNTGAPINIRASGNYFWSRVSGNSMNQATPISIEGGDYILVNANISPTFNDIVVAALVEPTSITDRAGIVKRFTQKGLISESTEYYENINLARADIRGVVIAIAKPYKNINVQELTLVKITIEKSIDLFGAVEINELINAISVGLRLPVDEIKLIYILPGSVQVILEMSDEGAARFERMIRDGNEWLVHFFARFGITGVVTKPSPDLSQPEILAQLSIDQIREIIIKDQLHGAKILSEYLKGDDDFAKARNDVDTLRASLENIKKAEIMGTAHRDYLTVERNRICIALLFVCDNIKHKR